MQHWDGAAPDRVAQRGQRQWRQQRANAAGEGGRPNQALGAAQDARERRVALHQRRLVWHLPRVRQPCELLRWAPRASLAQDLSRLPRSATAGPDLWVTHPLLHALTNCGALRECARHPDTPLD